MTEETKATPQESTPEAKATSGQEGKKLFTQEEVAQMVSEQLAQSKPDLERVSQKEQELNAREARMNCREYIAEKSLPKVLLEVLDTSDTEKFKEAADKLQKAIGLTVPSMKAKDTGMSQQGGHEVGWYDDDEIGNAFRL